MPTVEIKTIKPAGGGDYVSINAWGAAEAEDIISSNKIKIAEVYGGGNCMTTQYGFASWTMDSDHYVIVRAANSQKHLGIDNINKAYLNLDEDYALGVGSNNYVYLQDMQIKSNLYPLRALVGGNLIVDRCIVRSNYAALWQGMALRMDGGIAYVRNSICIAGAFGTYIASEDESRLYVFNSDIICMGNAGYPAIGGVAGMTVSNNNYIYHIGDNPCYSNASFITKGANDATYNTEAITVALRNKAYSTANFVNVTAGTENLALPLGSALIDAGANLAASGVTVDILNNNRPFGGVFDIGAFEFGATSKRRFIPTFMQW